MLRVYSDQQQRRRRTWVSVSRRSDVAAELSACSRGRRIQSRTPSFTAGHPGARATALPHLPPCLLGSLLQVSGPPREQRVQGMSHAPQACGLPWGRGDMLELAKVS